MDFRERWCADVTRTRQTAPSRHALLADRPTVPGFHTCWMANYLLRPLPPQWHHAAISSLGGWRGSQDVSGLFAIYTPEAHSLPERGASLSVSVEHGLPVEGADCFHCEIRNRSTAVLGAVFLLGVIGWRPPEHVPTTSAAFSSPPASRADWSTAVASVPASPTRCDATRWRRLRRSEAIDSTS
jgi:hypothetical protein